LYDTHSFFCCYPLLRFEPPGGSNRHSIKQWTGAFLSFAHLPGLGARWSALHSGARYVTMYLVHTFLEALHYQQVEEINTTVTSFGIAFNNLLFW
jgi:hypothetical protein